MAAASLPAMMALGSAGMNVHKSRATALMNSSRNTALFSFSLTEALSAKCGGRRPLPQPVAACVRVRMSCRKRSGGRPKCLSDSTGF